MEELDYYWKKVQKITDPEELVKEKENLLEVALLDQIFQLLLWLLLKKVKKILMVSPQFKDQIDYMLKEPQKLENYIT